MLNSLSLNEPDVVLVERIIGRMVRNSGGARARVYACIAKESQFRIRQAYIYIDVLRISSNPRRQIFRSKISASRAPRLQLKLLRANAYSWRHFRASREAVELILQTFSSYIDINMVQ